MRPAQPPSNPSRILFRAYNEYIPVERSGHQLPHWKQAGATYFVTFRLGDSIPVVMQRQWEQERKLWLSFHPEPWSDATQAEYDREFGERMDAWLDQGYGECHLRDPALREAVQQHITCFDGERHHLDAFVLMPNHVHAILQPREGYDLFKLLQGVKGASARECNKMLAGSSSTFWMADTYNRIVRDSNELCAFRRYIAANPIKAKLSASEFTLVLNDVLYTSP